VPILLVLAAVGLTVWAHLRAQALDDRGVRLQLAWLAGAVALLALLRGLARSGPPLALWLALAAGTGLVAWAALSRLVAISTRRRDLVLRIPLLAGAALALAAGASTAAGVTAGLGTLRYGWKSRFETGRLFQLGIAAVLLAALAWFAAGPIGRVPLEGWRLDLARFGRAIAVAAGIHASAGALALFGAFVRDPSLGIRRVSWRLALSHLLVVAVPLGLVLAMWVFTTVLGVGQERAGVGVRALHHRGGQLEHALGAALAADAAGVATFESQAPVVAAGDPGLRLWRRRGARFERVAGEPLAGDSALASWVDSLGRFPGRSLVFFADTTFLGAAVARGGDGAVALLPLAAMLEPAGRLASARIRVSPDIELGDRDLDDLELEARSPEDSAAVEEARRVVRRLGLPETTVRTGPDRRSARFAAGRDTFLLEESEITQVVTQGMVMETGIAHGPDGWRRGSFLVVAGAPAGDILTGVFRLSEENPASALPIVLLVFSGTAFLALAIWNVIMVTNMGRSITRAIGALRTAAARLQGGDLSHRIEVGGKDELWDVAAAFNLATDGLARVREMEKEQDRIENELQVARRIQERLLPSAPPRVPGLEIAGHYDPAREVGGDFFDHVPVDERRVLLAIADVSGKSVPAALIMSGFRAALLSQDLARIEPAPLAARLNELLHASLDPGKFVTAFLGFLDGPTGRLVYVNAGHNPPALLRLDGSDEWLERGGTILGILPGTTYEQGEANLEPGDLLALYTDGVTEGAAPGGEQWGDSRLVTALRGAAGRPVAEVAAGIADEVRAFEGERGATDDITLVIARRLG
jgi:HAMP domain-containing protein